MSTRGAWGFHFRGKTLATYNHCDSYPAGLGRKVLRFVRDNDIEEIKKMAGELIPVDACDTPPAEDRKALGKYRNSRVNNGADEWYNLLHRVQSDPQAYLDDPGLRAFIDSTSFLEDSLFCEWAYVVNLDEGFLEVYKGFRREPPKFSRYYDEKTFEPGILPSGRRNKYYPVEQLVAVAFADIKSGRFTEENFDCRTDGIADIEAHPPRPPALTPGAIRRSIEELYNNPYPEKKMKISVRSVSAIAVIAAAEKLPPVKAEFGRRVVADVLRGFPLPPVAVDRRPAMGSQDVGDWKIVRNGEYVRAMYEYAKERFAVQFDPDDPLWRLQDICLVFDLPRRVRTNRFEQAPVTAALIDGGSDSEVAAYLEAWDERHISGMGK